MYTYLIKHILKRLLFLVSFHKFKVFHSFPFNPNKPLPSEAFKHLTAVLDLIAVPTHSLCRISDGTLLGLYRNSKLIDHDNDIDFDLFNYEPNNIRALAKKQNWKLGREVLYCNKCQQLTYFTEFKLVIDFLFWYKDGPFAKNFSEEDFIRVQPVEFFTQSTLLEINNFNFVIPRDINRWLVYRYGLNWSIPNTHKSDWKIECGDLIRLNLIK